MDCIIFFEQSGEREKLIIADSITSELPCSPEPLRFVPADGLTKPYYDTAVSKFIAKRRTVPRKVVLKDYNYQTPNVNLVVEHEVSANGVGTHYSYGDTFITKEVGQGLAEVRAQAFSCREIMLHGAGYAPCLAAGHTFDLGNHPRRDWNAAYQVVSVKHRGWKNWKGVTVTSVGKAVDRPGYENVFEAIDAKTQFRPERVTPRPEFKGLLTAFIDSAQSGQYAELDELGRYKVRLPFDLADKGGGKASCWMRLAQPYAGQDFGMHFPLHKGAEVLLSFVDGDVDRPVIVSAVPNAELGNVVKDASETGNIIRTSSGNVLQMNDLSGKESISFSTPKANTRMIMGSYILPTSAQDAAKSKGQQNDSPFNFVLESEGNCSTTSLGLQEFLFTRTTMAGLISSTSIDNSTMQLSKSSKSLLGVTEWCRSTINQLAKGDMNTTGENINTIAKDRLTLIGGGSSFVAAPLAQADILMALDAAINLFTTGLNVYLDMVNRLNNEAKASGQPPVKTPEEMQQFAREKLIVDTGLGLTSFVIGEAVPTILNGIFSTLATGRELAPASINLDSKGINMRVTPLASPFAEMNILYGNSSILPHSAIKLFNPALPTVSIESGMGPALSKALLQLSGGVNVKLGVEPIGFGLELGPSAATLQFKPLGSKIALNPASMTLSLASRQQLELSPACAKLSSPALAVIEGTAAVQVTTKGTLQISGTLASMNAQVVMLG